MIDPFVELLGRVMRGRSDQLHAPRVHARTGLRRKERVVDVDDGRAEASKEVAGEDLHVPCEDDEVHLAGE